MVTKVKPSTVLIEANNLVSGPRADSYGNATVSNDRIAKLWTAHLQNVFQTDLSGELALNASDVALMMVLLKVAREEGEHKRDNLVDIAGWTQVASLIAED